MRRKWLLSIWRRVPLCILCELWRICWVVHILSMSLSTIDRRRTHLHTHLCNVTARLALQCWHCHAPMRSWKCVGVSMICARGLPRVLRWHAPKTWPRRTVLRVYASVAVLNLRLLRRQGRSITEPKLLLLVRQRRGVVRKPVRLSRRVRRLTMLRIVYVLHVYLRRRDSPVWEHVNVLASNAGCCLGQFVLLLTR